MKIRERHYSDDDDYSYTVLLEFEDLQTSSKLEEPVEGLLKIDLSDEFPYPVEVDIKSDMVAGENKDAIYAEFDNLSRELEDPNESLIEFQFKTKSAPHSKRHGAKVYSFKTADYDPETNISPDDDSEFIEHHIGIPSAQRVRLITNIIHRVLNEEANQNDIQKMMRLYDEDRSSAVDNFHNDIKKYADFESQVKVQNFLIGNTQMYRSHSDTVDKVAKQITNERLRHRIQSLDDVRDFISVINSQENFPEITVKEVFDEVYTRKEGDREELDEIAEYLGIDDWSVVLLE
ncbi:MAG: hypothetical protein U5J64_07870 [Halobacteriales archaeon]|nr:hypothetical protein [Halobacteriales archaeon]